MLHQVTHSAPRSTSASAFLPAIALLGVCLNCAAQTVTYSDATFPNEAWTTIKVLDTTPQQDATGVSTQDQANGNAPPCRMTVHDWQVTGPGVSIAFAHLRQGAQWNPASRGPIVNLEYSFSARCFTAPLVNAVGFTLILKQGNNYFTAPGVAAIPGQPWQVFSGSVTPQNLNPFPGNVNQLLDFSANAPSIDFGYYTGNGGSGASFRNSASAAIDNWSVTITPCLDVTTQPISVLTCPAASESFSVSIAGNGPFVYQWRKNSLPIDSGTNPSAATSTLLLTNLQIDDAGSYDCTISNTCGTAISDPATLSVCAANFNCDNAVDFFDYLDFVDAFSANSPESDFNHDSAIDFFDYLDFVDAFSTGC